MFFKHYRKRTKLTVYIQVCTEISKHKVVSLHISLVPPISEIQETENVFVCQDILSGHLHKVVFLLLIIRQVSRKTIKRQYSISGLHLIKQPTHRKCNYCNGFA